MSKIWYCFEKQKLATLGLICIIAGMLLGLLAPKLTSHDPFEQNLLQRYQAPNSQHLCGTDQFGRDILSRLLIGARVSLSLGLAVTVIALLIGTILGAVAGNFGGAFDAVIMRSADLLLSFPIIYLLVTGVAFFGTNWAMLILVMGLTSWMEVARLIRAEILSLKERDFIKAAHVLGFSQRRIIFRHLLPNALTPLIVLFALRLADAILIESSLSFLGLGVQPPAVSWGSIIRDGRDVFARAWWIVTFPGLAIVLTAIALNWVAAGLRRNLHDK